MAATTPNKNLNSKKEKSGVSKWILGGACAIMGALLVFGTIWLIRLKKKLPAGPTLTPQIINQRLFSVGKNSNNTQKTTTPTAAPDLDQY
jgi:hypothetical protein